MQNKNLKLKLGLCGLALTSFLALNAHSTVHADTMQNNNTDNNAITWDSDSDDSQVVKEESQQQTAPQAVQKQAKQSTVQASQSQPVQNKKIMVSDVSSTSVSQKRAETSIVRQSNAQTSTANRLNANKSQANIKVSNVQDVAQAPVQKQKVAQFNQGSKIYSLNNGPTVSKNNGDGYVITNAGTYNGRAVDIGVTINNVQDDQGSYTTKWSNGDKADVTGKVDNQFNYQNSALLGTTSQQPQVDTSRTRTRTETEDVNIKLDGWWIIDTDYHTWAQGSGETGSSGEVVIAPDLIKQIMEKTNCTYDTALFKLGIDTSKMVKTHIPTATMYENGVSDKSYIDQYYVGPITTGANSDSDYLFKSRTTVYHVMFTDKVNDKNLFDSDDWMRFPTEKIPAAADGSNARISSSQEGTDLEMPDKAFDPNWGIDANGRWTNNFDDIEYYFVDDAGNTDFHKYRNVVRKNIYTTNWRGDYVPTDDTKKYLSLEPTNVTTKKDVQVTDTLQLDHVNNGSLNYDYTVGLYDAQTGDLITDLKPEYKSKAGKSATNQDTVMNNAIKAKIQAINANKANSAYTGTVANDDVAFYKETRAVNPQDQSLHKSATRIISVNLPDDPAVKDRYEGILNSNNQIVQTINFTRTGVENIVSGQVTYGAWTGPSSFSAVTLPDIPGYTMTMN